MKAQPAILSLDQGTTSSRAMVFDASAQVLAVAQQEFPQIYPNDGWVEHDAEVIWGTTLETARSALKQAEAKGHEIAAIGITNQRETSVVWERASGKPIYNAIVWQDRRTSEQCAALKADNIEQDVQGRTGLLVDPYFSATKIAWILDKVEGARARAERGELAFGTIDSFLMFRLTGGKSHVTDATNASRTSLYNIHTGEWDEELLRLFNIPRTILPKVLNCIDEFGSTDPAVFGNAIPILGVAGDQQAATVGQCCFKPGDIKSTYGTGCFVIMNTGDKPILSKNRLLTTIAYQIDGVPTYAIEGSIFMAGAAVQWLRDGMGLIANAAEAEKRVESLPGNGGVYLVPAFTGLGAPWWNPDARGAIFGLTRASGSAEVIRATLESVAYQTVDLLDAMAQDGANPAALKVDGGMVANDWLMQFLSNVCQIPVQRPAIQETTALGVAYLAGLGAGLFENFEQIQLAWKPETEYMPSMGSDERRKLLKGWHQAISRLM